MNKNIPLSPAEVLESKVIDPRIFEVVNTILLQRFTKGSTVTILKSEIENKLRTEYENINIHELYQNKQFDFEDEYRNKGWKVEYDQPAYCETYEASYKFSAKK